MRLLVELFGRRIELCTDRIAEEPEDGSGQYGEHDHLGAVVEVAPPLYEPGIEWDDHVFGFTSNRKGTS